MKVKTAVRKYLETEREIFLQSINDIGIYVVHKDRDFYLEFGEWLLKQMYITLMSWKVQVQLRFILVEG